MTTNSHLSARQQNLKRILSLLDENDELSAKDLSNLTGLSIVSINKLIDVLSSHTPIIATNFINTRGRRAKTYHLNYQAYKLGIVELMENHKQVQATFFFTDLTGKIQSPQYSNSKISSIDQLIAFIKQATKNQRPQKIIVGVPGTEINGYLQISDVESLRGINLSATIQKNTGIETIIVNDANAATFGAAIDLKESQNISVGLYFPNDAGPGVGIVINNHLINGADGLAGEVEYGTIDEHQDITRQIIQYVQNIISFLNPHLIVIYIERLSLTNLQTKQIEETIKNNLPLHKKYRLDFSRSFEKDYLKGLATIGRKNILQNLVII